MKLHQATVPAAAAPLSAFGLVAFVISYVIGFFATAGAAGVDFGTNSRDERDVQMGGFVGIAIAIIFTAGLAMLIVAGAYGKQDIAAAAAKDGKMSMDAFNLIPIVLGSESG